MSSQTKIISGSPVTIGTESFIKILMPVIREASLQMNSTDLAAVYAGILMGAFGSLEADFGKEFANEMVDTLSQTYLNGAALDGGGLKQ
jgi:hypothetical protein